MKLTLGSNFRFLMLAIVLFGGALALQPSISLAVFDFPTFRISAYHVAAVLLVVLTIPLLKSAKLRFLKKPWVVFLILAFFATLVVGQIFSLMPMRTALYSASLVFLLVVGFCSALLFSNLTKSQKDLLVKFGLWSGVVLGILAICQLVIASFNPTAFGTLCSGCHSNVFGFPRINLFAAEPQFFASALLPALFLALFFHSKNPRLAKFSLFFTALAISLTFSRGAFFAIGIAVFALILIKIIRRQNLKNTFKSLIILVSGVLIGFLMLILSATIRFSHQAYITHNTAVSMLDQLSLGLVDIPQKTEKKPPPEKSPTSEKTEEFTPAGHVEASADERVSAADLALEAWSHSPKTALFGTGLGNLGKFIQENLNRSVPNDQTVYIFYILLLSNIGIIGLLTLLIPLFLAIKFATKSILKNPNSPQTNFAFCLLASMTVQFWFFGSLINTLHVFAWIGVFLYNYPINYAKKS